MVEPDGTILAGHTRWLAARKLGMARVPVHIAVGLTAAQRRAYRLMDNRSHEEATWDLEILGLELGELKGLDLDLSLTGFDTRELDKLLLVRNPAEDDAPPLPDAPVSRLGDVWLMGAHRLVCGDVRRGDHVARACSDVLVDLVFTDPPYGVGYDGGTTVRKKLQGDETTHLYAPACDMAALNSKAGAALYLWHAGVKGIAAAAAAAAAGYEIRCEIVWNKNLAQFGSLSAQYKQKHEPCYYCFKRGKAPAWYGPTNEVTVWDCDRARVNEFHPTQKPVEIVERAIKNSSKSGDVVLDMFTGSGSTLIGCEQTGRNFAGLEIEPGYIDVAILRWQSLTNKQAILEGSGATFEHVRDGRRLEAEDNLKEEVLNATR